MRLVGVLKNSVPTVIDFAAGWAAPPPTSPDYPAPATLTAVVTGANNRQVRLDWAAVPGAIGYQIHERQTVPGPVTTIAAPTLTRTSGELAWDDYYYSVRAVFSGGLTSAHTYTVPTKITVAPVVAPPSTNPNTPTPTPTTGGFPNASNSGLLRADLLPATKSGGDFVPSQGRMKYSNLWFAGCAQINFPDIEFENCLFEGMTVRNGTGVMNLGANASGFTIRRSELGTTAKMNDGDGFNGKRFDYTASYIHVHHLVDGAKYGSGLIEHSYFHDFGPLSPRHHDGLQQMIGNTGDTVVHHNTLLLGSTPKEIYNSPLFTKADTGPIGDVYWTNNYIDGGGYAAKISRGPQGIPNHVYVTGNRFGRSATWGPMMIDKQAKASLALSSSDRVTLSDNRYLDNNALIDSDIYFVS